MADRLVPAMPQEPIEHCDFEDDADECPNCGGEGWVSGCFEEWVCRCPDEGCERCMRRCDWCAPSPAKLLESP